MELKAVILCFVLSSAALVTQGQLADTRAVFASNSEVIVYSDELLDLTNQIDIYPNPSVNFIVVNIENSNLKKVTFQLHSVIGNTVDVQAESIGKDKYKIDLRNYSSGYYFLIIEDEETQFKEAYKFLKK
ncbi:MULTISPECIES: T9SS type A sorting domain-containing protein [Reichenbachiella]|uniref:Por secretion system C-terminal sorting domain-containing protein n=1 Tax=Reichenbachiella agariperforans TaxID=156994 RepID=A0A1M6RC59_REIAG|nr:MULTISPECIES: T9SS type A sorting domain-containing protein [Reichenbachiella]MBU2914562.1 T9SS type A sorting domain-containing protein [Reichenbachiella agariperforans]RJE70603.1 hypothetical protein BGP76_10990 [Reichenbachiella sp. MSK19-1]SHK30026.1 Por secretion system C-terminal sorting domain-containing protein [Reichenbachiella agariperforans]